MKPWLGLGLVAFLAVGLLIARPASEAAAQPTGGLLTNIPVTQELAGGGVLEGTLSITRLALDNGQLVASGVLAGTVTQTGSVTEFTQTFTDVPVNLTRNQGGSCDILFLDLGPLFLDLLGLQVDLSPITLDVRAVPGAGNLLGNLLCALVGLLDGPGARGNAAQALLSQINSVLGGR
jgi:hypothetical protein